MTERFVKVLDDEVYYLVDLEGLKPFSDFLDVIWESYPDYDDEAQYELACDDYTQYLYEHSMTGDENLRLLNGLYKENKQLKQSQDELYDFRLVYNALLFNEWDKTGDVEVYKSRKHHDGTIPFDDSDWFIVVAILPTGKQVTNHYHIDYWDYFKIKEYDKVKDEFDGHTSIDVLDRLKEELKGDVE